MSHCNIIVCIIFFSSKIRIKNKSMSMYSTKLFNAIAFSLQGWYIITYALGIYHLNLFIAFLTPKIDPAMDFDGKVVLCCV